MVEHDETSPRRPTRRTFIKGAAASGALLGAGIPQVLLPTLWRQAGATADPPFGLHLEFGAASHMRDSGHAYGFASFDVDPGSEEGGWTTINVRYHRVLNPLNPADVGKEVEFDSFTLRRRRRDGGDEADGEREGSTPQLVTADT